MKAKKFLLGLVAAAMSLSIAPVAAAEFEASAGVDLVSSYVWRGVYQGAGAALQPSAGVSIGGFSVSAWGSTSLSAVTGIGYEEVSDDAGASLGLGSTFAAATKELDFTVGYDFDFGLSIAVTDYWWAGEDASYFDKSSHYYELALSYTISEDIPLSIGVATMIGGADKKYMYRDGASTLKQQNFSTYLSLGYTFDIGGVACDTFIGATPFAGAYSGDTAAGICSVGATFSYDLVKSDKFALPIFVETSFSPINDDAYIVAGFSFSL